MLNPAYRLTVGDQRIDSTAEPLASILVNLVTRLDMTPAADRFALTLGRIGSFTPEREDEAKIELGYAGEDEPFAQVMRGVVDEVDAHAEQVRAVGFGAAAILGRSYTDKTFRDQTAAAIVRDLAERASVAVARAAASEVLPYYVIDGRVSFLRHMADLAELTGFDFYLDSDDRIVFEPFGVGQQLHPLGYARDLLDYRAERTPTAAGAVEAWGESPGATAGAESWSWLTKDFESLRGQAGTAEPLQLLERSALRTAESAQRAAAAAFTRSQRRQLRGCLVILGNPRVRLGDAVRLEDMPEDDLNATFQVRRLRHRLNKTTGFTTEIGFRAIGDGS